MAKQETQITTVTMLNGDVVDFPGKRRIIKTTNIEADGTINIRLDFVNGETRHFTVPQALLAKFAAHGAEQKLGDETAGLTDIDDCVIAIDDLTERLNKGEWNIKRESGGMAGASVLAKALIEHTGKTPEQIKQFLSTKTQAEKQALRANAKIRPIVERIEAEKAAKKSNGAGVDTEALLGELEV